MTAELISVGTEILMGNILNSNARYLAEKCASLGLDMYYQVTVGDNYDRMMAVVKTALDRSDIVIVQKLWEWNWKRTLIPEPAWKRILRIISIGKSRRITGKW